MFIVSLAFLGATLQLKAIIAMNDA